MTKHHTHRNSVITLSYSLSTFISECTEDCNGSSPSTLFLPPVRWLWAGLGVGFLANCSGVSPSPSFHTHAHTFIPFSSYSLLSPLFPPQFLSRSSKSLYKETFCLDGVIDKRIYIQLASSKGTLGLNRALQMCSDLLFSCHHHISMCAPM